MRPLHSLLVVVALIAVAAGGWWLLNTNDPANRITAAGPAAAAPVASAPRDDEPLRELDRDASPRRVGTVATPELGASTGASAQAAPTSQGRALEGRVVGASGAPVAGARVLLGEGSAGFLRRTPLDSDDAERLFGRREGETDAEGRFRFEGVDASAVRIAVRASGFAPYDANDVPMPSSSRLADIVLERGAYLAGRVLDAAGRPVPGVSVLRAAEDPGGFVFGGGRTQVASTSADGRFAVDVLAVGPWRLRFESDAHPNGELSGRTERPGERVEGLIVQLEQGGTIAGRVTGQLPDGQGFERLSVSATPLSDSPDGGPESRSCGVSADGGFSVRGVRAGQRYLLRAVRREEPFGGLPIEFLPGLTASVEAEAGESGVVLVLAPESALAFQVVDASSGAPLEDFRVRGGVGWAQPLTDERGEPLEHHPGGRVRMGNLRPRSSGERATLSIEAVGYLPYQADGLKLTPGVDTELGTIALEPAPLLTVRVVDDSTGAPIEGADVHLARVEAADEPVPGEMRRTIRASATFGGGGGGDLAGQLLEGESRSAKTDADGVARVTLFADRDVRLRVRAPNRAPWVGAVYRAPTAAEEREVRMTRGGTVVVHLFDAAGEPHAGGRVEHRAIHEGAPVPDFRSPELSNEDGEARFEHLAAGRHRFRRAGGETGGVFRSNGATFALLFDGEDAAGDEWVEVEVVEGGLHDVEVHLPLELAVHGRLTEGGEPLSGASLSLSAVRAAPAGMPELPMLGGGGPQTSSDADGSWRFEGVEPGDYTLRITHAERSMPSEVRLTVSDGDLQRDVDLDVAVIEGRVVDAAGEPLAGVEVWPERAQAEGAPRAVRVMAFASAGGGSMMTLGDGGGASTRARTDADGRYVLRGVQADVELQVHGRGEGLQPGRSQPLRVAADQRRTGVDLTLASAGWIEVEGVYADGSPAANLLVTGRYEGERSGVEPQTILLDPTGTGRLEGLAPGPWRLSARALGPGSGDAAPAEVVVDVAAGETTPARLTAP